MLINECLVLIECVCLGKCPLCLPWCTVSTATGAAVDIVDSVDMISMDIYCGRWGMVQCCGDLEPQHCHTPRSQHGSDVK